MTEFNNRIAAQRELLGAVNSIPWKEELFGLSSGALNRWMHNNGIEPSSDLAELLVAAAAKLYFLANKSQEQITDEYRLRANEVSELTRLVRQAIYRHG
jgi:hypothetical protein